MSPAPSNKLFGTDGIRGTFGTYPMDPETIYRLGKSLKEVFGHSSVVIGRDTRQSGTEIEKLLTDSMAPEISLVSAGIIPTPALSFITQENSFQYGVMITASHNPCQDNGIKIFNHLGEKITLDDEKEIEQAFFKSGSDSPPASALPAEDPTLAQLYKAYLVRHLGPMKQQPSRMIIDCANGATSRMAPEIFKHSGWEITAVNARPDGTNINNQCGSNHPETLQKRVLEDRADWGIAFDGDGDRVTIVDRQGNILNGDTILYILSRYIFSGDNTPPPVVVGTVMSNLGLETALKKDGISLERSPVGDRNVYQMMIRSGSVLGGEDSGHIIIRKYLKSGDGMLTAIMFFRAIQALGISPDTASGQLKLYPQSIRSIPIREKRDLSSWEELNRMIEQFNLRYGEYSRMVIRYSGTEPKIRIMLESRENDVVTEEIQKFEKYIRSEIGG